MVGEILIGIVIGGWISRAIDTEVIKDYKLKVKQSARKKQDIVNWIKSEIRSESNPKMGKVVDKNKISFLKRILYKIETC